jgi:copper/silver efflux system protein
MIDRIIELSIAKRGVVFAFFAVLFIGSFWAIKNMELDALPDLTPPQVIVAINWEGQSPQNIENRVTNELVKSFMSIPRIETVRGFSSFGNGFVYVIFKEGTDLYYARSRTLEYLSQMQGKLPMEVSVTLGPDATGVGWILQYALVSNKKNLAELRTYQDYTLRYALLGVLGVSEVASIGGFVKNYEVTVDPVKAASFGLSIKDVSSAIGSNNQNNSGRLIIENGFENGIQTKGFYKNENDIENTLLKSDDGQSVKISDIANVQAVPSERRGIADLNGEGETVGGIVVARYKASAYQVIQSVKEKLATLGNDDINITLVYDRSEIIDKALNTLTRTLIEESVIVAIIISLFLFHLSSSLIIVLTLPLTIALTFLAMKLFGIGSNIMSLGGIAIAIGAMIDAGIVIVENAHKHLHAAQERGEISFVDRVRAVQESTKEVGAPIFFALLLVVVSFLPIFTLTGQEGALFSPLAFTKSFAMFFGAIIAITLVPALCVAFLGGKIPSERANPINRFFIDNYARLMNKLIHHKTIAIAVFVVGIVATYPVYKSLKWEFMPPLNEESLMYMPVTPYGISIDAVKDITVKTDEIIKSFPEVASVFGKAGRANSATDPAPLSMLETVIMLKPKAQWRAGVTYESLQKEMDTALQIEGLTNSWTYPIRGRIDMLLTGIRTPLGIKVYGKSIEDLQSVSSQIEAKLKGASGTASVFAERASAGYYLNIDPKTQELSRYGLSKNELFEQISFAIGGMNASVMYEGVERYPISVRAKSEYRNDIDKVRAFPIKTPLGFVSLESMADTSWAEEVSEIKSEKGLFVNYVYIMPKDGVSSVEYKEEAKKLLAQVKLPLSSFYEWAGHSEYLEEAMKSMAYIIPLCVVLTFALIFAALRNFTNTLIVFFTLPFAFSGGVMFVKLLGYDLSVATVVGFLALLGIAAETAIVMIVYLQKSCEKLEVGYTDKELKEACIEGSAHRVRPKLMTVLSLGAGLLPIMYISGVGSEIMRNIAAPMMGGLVSSTALTLFILPSLYFWIRSRRK